MKTGEKMICDTGIVRVVYGWTNWGHELMIYHKQLDKFGLEHWAEVEPSSWVVRQLADYIESTKIIVKKDKTEDSK